MSVQVWGMMEAGVAALVAGLILVWARFGARASLRSNRARGFCRRALPCRARSRAHRAALVAGSSVLDLLRGRGVVRCSHQLRCLATCALGGGTARTAV